MHEVGCCIGRISRGIRRPNSHRHAQICAACRQCGQAEKRDIIRGRACPRLLGGRNTIEIEEALICPIC